MISLHYRLSTNSGVICAIGIPLVLAQVGLQGEGACTLSSPYLSPAPASAPPSTIRTFLPASFTLFYHLLDAPPLLSYLHNQEYLGCLYAQPLAAGAFRQTKVELSPLFNLPWPFRVDLV